MYRLATFAIIVSIAAIAAYQPGEASQSGSARGFALPEGDAAKGKQAFTDLKCTTCHTVAGLEDEFPRPTARPMVDVKLGGLAMREPTDGELVTSVVNPNHRLYPGAEKETVTSGGESRMANMNEAMTVQQLIDLVAFLHERYETTGSQDR